MEKVTAVTFLLTLCIARSAAQYSSFAVVVDAKDEDARRFYEREGFLLFADQATSLLRPVADIAELYK